MKPFQVFRLCFVGLTLVAFAQSARAADVPQWTPHDSSFKASANPTNPFMTSISATVTGPDGKSFSIPGFYDGDGTWKIRASPNMQGEWSLVTKSDIKELDGQHAKFTCIQNADPKVHGVLRVDKNHPHHFIFEDGTRFFMQGYEYDWLWGLDMDKANVPTIEKSLDILAKYGFNYVIVNSYAQDTAWRKGKLSDDDYGPSLLYAWEGNNDQPDHSRMNLAYWQHYDRMMTALAERGIQAHMLIKVYNKAVKWPERGSDDEKLFFRWLVARYAAYPNIIWDFAKEAHNEKDLAYKQNWLKWLRENDPYLHLVTVHDDDKANDAGEFDEITDFRADQGHSNFHALILRQRERRAWPVANVESDYEHGPGGLDDKTYGKTHTPEGMIRTAWEIQMAGGYNAYYYTYTAWDVIRPFDVPPGYVLYKHFGDFWRSTEYWKLKPSDQLVDNGWCMAQPGIEYVVFQNEATPFTLKIEGVKATRKAAWFHPHTGQRTEIGPIVSGTVSFTPPADWGKAPLVLHVTNGAQ